MPSRLTFVKISVCGRGFHQFVVRADERFAVVHKDEFVDLREMIQPVRNQKDHLIFRVFAQVFEYRVLGVAVERGKGIVARAGRCA